MTIIQAIKRLSFTTSKGNKCNDGDVDALNTIIEWVNKEKETRINENRYFGKLAIYTYLRELDYYEDSNLAEVKINDILSRPLSYWYDRIRLNFVMRELELNYKILGFENIAEIWDKHKDENNYFDVSKIKNDGDASKKIFEDNVVDITKALLTWPQKEINANFNVFISELLTEHGNKP